MIDGLICGRLHGTPVQRIGSSGKPFVVAKVRIPVDGDSLFASVICFDETVGAQLMGLSNGDAVTLSGELKPKVWIPASGAPKVAIDLICHGVMTIYHTQRKRQAMQPAKPQYDRDIYQAALAPLDGQ